MCKVASLRKTQADMIANTPSGMYYNFIIASNNSVEKVTLTIVLVGTKFVFIFPVAKCRQSEFLTIATVCVHNSSILAWHIGGVKIVSIPKVIILFNFIHHCIMNALMHFLQWRYPDFHYTVLFILERYLKTIHCWMSNEFLVNKWKITFLFRKSLVCRLAYGWLLLH